MMDMKHTNVAQFIGAVVEPPELMVVWEYCTKGGLQVSGIYIIVLLC